MKPSLLLVLLIFPFMHQAAAKTKTSPEPNLTVQYLRETYILAVEDDEVAQTTLERLEKLTDKTALVLAYEGAFEALVAKHVWNPYKKLAYLKRSQRTLEKAIGRAPKDIEIRFLRFSIQHYLPEFLKDSQNYKSDFEQILQCFSAPENAHLDALTQNTIAKFLIDSGKCTHTQKQFLSQFISS